MQGNVVISYTIYRNLHSMNYSSKITCSRLCTNSH